MSNTELSSTFDGIMGKMDGGDISSMMQEMMGMAGDLGDILGMDMTKLNGLMGSVSNLASERRLMISDVLSLGDEDAIINSLIKLDISIDHHEVVEELVTCGYIRAANAYCTHYSYTPNAEIAEIAQDQVLPFFFQYIDHPRLTHNVSMVLSIITNVKDVMNDCGMDSSIFDMFNDLAQGNNPTIDLSLDINELTNQLASRDNEYAKAVLVTAVQYNRLDVVKLILSTGHPLDAALDIAYEYGNDEIAEYILTQIPKVEETTTTLDALGLDDE